MLQLQTRGVQNLGVVPIIITELLYHECPRGAIVIQAIVSLVSAAAMNCQLLTGMHVQGW